ncbi:MAG: hypothetical protein HND39_13855 [Ignavibacteriota bacterium]|uniref:hypothetical protein n=1 Tax=Ignavibacterium album TaxID=591197 RepID=UPI00159A7CA4|nr:hypothetical protein [Ignavibacteriales bacterium]MBL1121594.1 hypothetical protein [Ignavibacteriota bacterium]MCE7855266.1 hypothetical protein [Ignavibacteria bacterium CHB3]OQY69550.1 MAG: hypothetical protein B6D44_17690 [Ignavibacteriales bacterium UTCHB2]GJQ42700.1 MAG: hypothetical protein JETCAE03_21980 [Ignavibacteriaceae bacterium]
MKSKFYFIAFLLLFFIGCEDEQQTVSGEGTISYFSLEGGFYGIITDSNEHFLPENLNPNFQKDSLRILFEGYITDKMTIQQWGRTIVITKIKSLQ